MATEKKPARVRDIRRLVDDAVGLHVSIKAMQKRLDALKPKFKQHAAATNKDIILGNKGKVHLSPYTKSSIDPQTALDTVNDLPTFLDIVKVSLPQYKNAVGEEVYEKTVDQKTKPRHSVRIMKLDEPIEDGGKLVRLLNVKPNSK